MVNDNKTHVDSCNIIEHLTQKKLANWTIQLQLSVCLSVVTGIDEEHYIGADYYYVKRTTFTMRPILLTDKTAL